MSTGPPLHHGKALTWQPHDTGLVGQHQHTRCTFLLQQQDPQSCPEGTSVNGATTCSQHTPCETGHIGPEFEVSHTCEETFSTLTYKKNVMPILSIRRRNHYFTIKAGQASSKHGQWSSHCPPINQNVTKRFVNPKIL
jgi:hypothetical protein